MLQWSSSNTCTFAIKHCTALLHVRILDNTYVLCLVAILRSEITGKKHKKFLSVVLNRMCKGPMFTAGELIEEEYHLVCSQLGTCMLGTSKVFAILHKSVGKYCWCYK